MVDPEVGKEVPDEHVVEAEGLGEVDKAGNGDTDTDVAQDNELGIAVLIQGAARIEVVDTTAETVLLALATALALALMVVVAGDVGQKVVGPADELLHDEHQEGEGGGLLGQLRQLVDELAEAGGLLLAGSGDEDHVALHVASGLVVLAVGDLPAEVGDEERRVQDPAGHIVDEGGVGEGAVAALVGNDPQTGAEETLEDRVQGPEAGADGLGGDVLGGDEVVVDGEGGGQEDDVAEDVEVALEGGALEAVLGDGIVDVLNGEVGGSELVAVRVEETAIVAVGLLGGGLGLGGERGERGRRGRVLGRLRRRNGSRGLGVGGRGRGSVPALGRLLPGRGRGRDGGHCGGGRRRRVATSIDR